MAQTLSKDLFYELYTEAHRNAVHLIQDAETLFENGRFPRAYSLAFTALEEIAKSQLAADVYTGLQTQEDFKKICYRHEKKIKRMAWATKEAAEYLSVDGIFVDIEKPTFKARNDAMYVELKDGTVYTPSASIGRKEAESIMHTANVAIERILEVIEMGEQIGTKGFMK